MTSRLRQPTSRSRQVAYIEERLVEAADAANADLEALRDQPIALFLVPERVEDPQQPARADDAVPRDLARARVERQHRRHLSRAGADGLTDAAIRRDATARYVRDAPQDRRPPLRYATFTTLSRPLVISS